MAKLVEISGYTPGREIAVGELLLLGRDPGDGGLVVANREASRRHAQIRRKGNEFIVEDLNSSNGTYVNGVRRPQASLPEGTLITVGRTTFKFSLEPIRSLASLSGVRGPGSSAIDSATPSSGALEVEAAEAGDDELEPGDETISRPIQSPPSVRTSQPARNIASDWNDLSSQALSRPGPSLGQLISPVSQGSGISGSILRNNGLRAGEPRTTGRASNLNGLTPAGTGEAGTTPKAGSRLERVMAEAGEAAPLSRVVAQDRAWFSPDEGPPASGIHESAFRPLADGPVNPQHLPQHASVPEGFAISSSTSIPVSPTASGSGIPVGPQALAASPAHASAPAQAGAVSQGSHSAAQQASHLPGAGVGGAVQAGALQSSSAPSASAQSASAQSNSAPAASAQSNSAQSNFAQSNSVQPGSVQASAAHVSSTASSGSHAPVGVAASNGLPAAVSAHSGTGSDVQPTSSRAPTLPPERRKGPVWNMMLDARATRMGESLGQEPESLQRERDILHHLCEISRTLGSILHLPDLVHEILLKAFELFPAAENASIHLLKDDSGLQPLAARSRSGGEIVPPPISQTIANMALSDRQSILSTDAAGDERFLNKQSIILHRVRSFMCSPLLFRDEVLGVLYVDTTDARPRFTPEDLRLFTAVSAQVAVAVKNSQLMRENLREAEVRLHLSRYLPPGLVDQVLNKQLDITPGGSLYEGTVLFSDVVGFTPMSERLGPVQLVTTLNRYFRHMVEVIFKYNGSVNKFGGDSIMALWGVPVKQGNDVLKAVCAAVEMQVAIFGFNLAAPDESEPLRVGIGLNTGTFVMGNVGSMQHMEYTALGNHVNLAQRVESQATGMQVFLSENTWQRVANSVSVFELPPRLLKGVSVPLPIYSVRAVRWQDEVICAIPGMLQWSTGMTAPCILSRVFPNQSFEVWTGRRPEPGSELLLRLDSPEFPAMNVMTVVVESSTELIEFTQDSTRQGWRVRMSAAQSLPEMFSPPSVMSPKAGYEYQTRA